ncbi:MAG TPA: hypothetical protein VIX38_00915 [Nitrososphaeraceae archaeon]
MQQIAAIFLVPHEMNCPICKQDYKTGELENHLKAEHAMDKNDIISYMVYLVDRLEKLDKKLFQ